VQPLVVLTAQGWLKGCLHSNQLLSKAAGVAAPCSSNSSGLAQRLPAKLSINEVKELVQPLPVFLTTQGGLKGCLYRSVCSGLVKTSVLDPKRLFQDPDLTFQVIPDPDPGPDPEPFPHPGQNHIF